MRSSVGEQLVGAASRVRSRPGPAVEPAGLDPGDLVRAQPGPAAEPTVLGQLVVGAAGGRDPEDHQLGLPAREPTAGHQPAGEVQPAPEQPPVAPEGAEHRRRLGAGDPPGDVRERRDDRSGLAPGAGGDPRLAGRSSQVRSTGLVDGRQHPVRAPVEDPHREHVAGREVALQPGARAGCRPRCRPSTCCGARPSRSPRPPSPATPRATGTASARAGTCGRSRRRRRSGWSAPARCRHRPEPPGSRRSGAAAGRSAAPRRCRAGRTWSRCRRRATASR